MRLPVGDRHQDHAAHHRVEGGTQVGQPCQICLDVGDSLLQLGFPLAGEGAHHVRRFDSYHLRSAPGEDAAEIPVAATCVQQPLATVTGASRRDAVVVVMAYHYTHDVYVQFIVAEPGAGSTRRRCRRAVWRIRIRSARTMRRGR